MPTQSLNVFSVPSMSDIGTLLKATKSSSPLDPIPLSLLHEITESLTIPLNNIFCESLESGTFPTSYKHALITPLLKKPNLDPQSLLSSNLKPVDIFQNFGPNRREITNVLFNITQNPSYLPKCISSFQINRNRTSEDIQRYSH